jgi:hypothetical protein
MWDIEEGCAAASYPICLKILLALAILASEQILEFAMTQRLWEDAQCMTRSAGHQVGLAGQAEEVT